MAHGTLITKVEDPGGVGLPKAFRPVLFGAVGLGLLLWIAGWAVDSGIRAWQSLLLTYVFFLCLGLGGMVFTAIQYCASARWSIAVRRISEGMASFIPYAFVLFLVIALFGYGDLYSLKSEWRAALGKGDVKIYDSLKAGWLSQPALIVKGILFYGVWFYLSNKIRRNSLEQDKSRDPRIYDRNQKLSIAFLILFAYTFSLHVIDMLKGLEPKWFSTIFGVYCFAGMFLTTLCVMMLVAHAMRRRRAVGDAIQERHLYDLGTWLMAFSCFMCYIGFSQYMLIWYANIPEETFYLIARSENGWQYVFAALPFFKWVVPFAVLMPQGFRADVRVHIFVAICVLGGQWLDLYWIIYPVFSPSPVMPGLAELGSFLAVLGVFGLVLDRTYSRHSVLPMGDPHLVTSVNGSYV